jgi:hypothetical protein
MTRREPAMSSAIELATLRWLGEGWPRVDIEHGVDYGPLLEHQADLRCHPDADIYRMTVIHPPTCGCDAYPNALEIEG